METTNSKPHPKHHAYITKRINFSKPNTPKTRTQTLGFVYNPLR
jgi:hypothetical protein